MLDSCVWLMVANFNQEIGREPWVAKALVMVLCLSTYECNFGMAFLKEKR